MGEKEAQDQDAFMGLFRLATLGVDARSSQADCLLRLRLIVEEHFQKAMDGKEMDVKAITGDLQVIIETELGLALQEVEIAAFASHGAAGAVSISCFLEQFSRDSQQYPSQSETWLFEAPQPA